MNIFFYLFHEDGRIDDRNVEKNLIIKLFSFPLFNYYLRINTIKVSLIRLMINQEVEFSIEI